MFIMHALEIKSHSSEGQEEAELKKKNNWMTVWTNSGSALCESLKSQLFVELKGCALMTELGFFVIVNEFFSLCHKF